MSKKSRKTANRRDRRKAKQSRFRRPGRSNPKKVGHGGSGEKTRGQRNVCVHFPRKMGKTSGKTLEVFGELLGDIMEDDDND